VRHEEVAGHEDAVVALPLGERGLLDRGARRDPRADHQLSGAAFDASRPLALRYRRRITATIGLAVSASPRTVPPAAERAERNRRIAEERARGEPWAVIAARHGLTERQARRAREEHLRSAVSVAPLDLDPNAVLAEAVVVHREVLADLALLGREADNDSARVGALRARAETSRRLLELLADAGVVPDSVGGWRFARDYRSALVAIARAAERNGVPLEEVVAEMDRAVGSLDPAAPAALASGALG
jgi:hypothetical protein